jgi:hypothetical protein
VNPDEQVTSTESPRALYESLTSVTSVEGMADDKVLHLIGQLIDVSLDLRESDGLKRALILVDGLRQRALSESSLALLDYLAGNAWRGLGQLAPENSSQGRLLEQVESERALLFFRQARRRRGFATLDKIRRCQILTSTGNTMNEVGRFVEAIENWNGALEIHAASGMALGSRGCAAAHYARALYDDGQRVYMLRQAHRDLSEALKLEITPDARRIFRKHDDWITSKVTGEQLRRDVDLDGFPMGGSEAEVAYRRWCLANVMFLNPMNDVCRRPIAAQDVLTVPNIVATLNEGPHYHGFYNQMKQEFVSARFLYFEGIMSDSAHYSDRDVLLYNTFDYPVYSLSAEKVRVAFRMAYSLVDKIAFFLNDYLGLGIGERYVYLKSIWYVSQDKNKGIRNDVTSHYNWPLRGLFWLSKDLYEGREEFREATEPDARALSDIRNHLEHKYLKLVEGSVEKPRGSKDGWHGTFADGLAFSVGRRDFVRKTLRLLKLSRAALIYLSLAVRSEEKYRRAAMPPSAIVPGRALDVYEDDCKR